MNHVLFAVGFALTLLASTVSAQPLDDAVKKVTNAEGSDVSLAYRELFSAVGPQGLILLRAHPDKSIAIQAAWEEVRLTVPVEFGQKVFQPEKEKLVWFVGFLEGRSRSVVPEWWVESVLGSMANRRDNIYGGDPKKSPYHESGLEYVYAPVGTLVKKEGKQFSVHVGNNSIAIPYELLKYRLSDDGSLHDSVSATFTENECFVTIHDDVGYEHGVACVDRHSGKVRWKSKACGCWWGGASGIHVGWVTIVTQKDRVTVFGKSSVGFYAHSFFQADGKTDFRFSNFY